MSTKTLSYEHAQNTIRLMYGHFGFEVEKIQRTLGQQVYSEFGTEVASSHLGALYAFVDEQLALLRMTSWYFQSAMTSPASAKRASVFYKIAITHMRTLASVRMLCSVGFDANARLELRKLYENAVLWTRLRLDATSVEDFYQACTAESANQFWHKYQAKGKSELFISNTLQDNQTWIGKWSALITELKLKIGPAAHPSFLTNSYDAQQDWDDQENKLVLNAPNRSSHFTLSLGMTCAAMPFSLNPDLVYELECEDFLKIGHPFNCIPHPTYSWEEYSTNIRNMIPALILMGVRFSEELITGIPGKSIERSSDL